METLVERPPIIDISMSAIDTFSRCRRKFMYQEVRGWQPRTASWPMIIGTAYHAAIAAGYSAVREFDLIGGTDNDRAQTFLEAALMCVGDIEHDRDGKNLGLTPEDRILIGDMVNYWFEKFGEADLLNVTEVLTVEEPLYVQVGPYRIRCTIDATLQYADQDAPMIVDHKTGDPEESKAWVALDLQTSIYYIAGRGRWGRVMQFGHRFQARDVPPGFGHRSVLTDTGKKRDAATLERMQDPKRYLASFYTELTDAQLDAYTEELIETIQEIDHAKATGNWTRSRIKIGPMACTGCPYFEPCKAERDGRTVSDEVAALSFIIRGSDEWQALEDGKNVLKVSKG